MSETGESAWGETVEQQSSIKNKRKQLRARITRSIKRIRESIQNEDKTRRRFEKELEQLRKDYDQACDFHGQLIVNYGQLYEFAEDSQQPAMDQWENDPTNDLYSTEEQVEVYLSSLSLNPSQPSVPSPGALELASESQNDGVTGPAEISPASNGQINETTQPSIPQQQPSDIPTSPDTIPNPSLPI